MASLTGSTIASSYLTLLKLTSAALGADASAKYIEDAAGTDSALSISTTRVGIGTASPDRSLHVSTGSAGTVTGNANAPLVLETAGDTNIQLLAPNTSDEFILFGSNSGNRTYIQVDLSATAANESFQIYTNSALAFKLDSNSRISLSNNDSGGTGGLGSTSGNTVLGYLAGQSIESGCTDNTFIGHGVSDASMDDAIKNTGVGAGALSALTTGDENIAVGYGAGNAMTTAVKNVLIGSEAGASIETSTSGNVAIGYQAGSSIANSNAHYNVIIGKSAGTGGSATMTECIIIGESAMNSTAANAHTGVIAIGREALTSLTSGGNNFAIGYNAGKGLTTAQQNLAIGREALENHVLGESNIAIGYLAMGDTGAGSSSHDSDHNLFIGLVSGGGSWADVKSEFNVGVGNYTLDGALSGALNNVAVGYGALTDLTQGDENVAVGYAAGADLTIGRYNTAFGTDALRVETVGDGSVAFGHNALKGQISDVNNESTKNTGLGYQTGYTNVTGTGNTYVGWRAGFGGSGSESNNTAVGVSALAAVTSGTGNIAVGYAALDALTDGNYNIGIGGNALGASVDGDFNIAIGDDSLKSFEHSDGAGNNVCVGFHTGQFATTAENSVFIGKNAAQGITETKLTGNNNTAIGYESAVLLQGAAQSNTLLGSQAGTSMTTGSYNTAIGTRALVENQAGHQNVAIGWSAGEHDNDGADVASPDNCVAIGYGSKFETTTPDNEIVIGHDANGKGDNTVVLGDDNITAVYMSEDSGATVHCAAVQIADGGNIGSASDTDAMAITAAGSVLFNTISYGSSQQITVANNTTQTITVTNKRVFLYNTHSGAQIQDIAFASNVGGIGAQVFFQLDNSSSQAVTFNEGGNIALSGTTSGLNGKLNGVLVMFYDGAKWLEQSYTALD